MEHKLEGSEQEPIALLTLEELKQRTGLSEVQLDQNIQEQDIDEIAKYFGDIEEFLLKFKFDESQKSDINRCQNTKGNKAAVRKALLLLQKRNPYAATFRYLIEVLLQQENGSIAIHVSEYIARNVTAHQDSQQYQTTTSTTQARRRQQQHPSAASTSTEQQHGGRQHLIQQHPMMIALVGLLIAVLILVLELTVVVVMMNKNTQNININNSPHSNVAVQGSENTLDQKPNSPSTDTTENNDPVNSTFKAEVKKQYFTGISIPLSPDITMINFEQRKRAGDMWYSPPVYTHHQGYKFCLGVVANGDLEGKGTHVTVAVYFMRGEFDDSLKWPFRGIIFFQLVDQLHGEHHLEHKVPYDDSVPDKHCSRVTEGERAKWGWGPDKLIAHNKLKPTYLQNNSLKFQIYKVELK